MNTQVEAEQEKVKSIRKITLDSSLRYLYDGLRYKRSFSLMAIEFKHNGKTWRADTPKEAIELLQQLEAIESGETTKRKSVWDIAKITDVLNSLGKLQQQLLIYVSVAKEVKSSSLVDELHLQSEIALAGVLSGLSKQVKEHGVEMKDVLRIDVAWRGKTKERQLSLSPDFIAVAETAGWPDAWQSKLDMEALDELDEKLEK